MPHVLFIPSQLLTADLWAPAASSLTGLAATSVADNSAHDSIGALAAAILATAPARFHLVAHGMGGFIAFEILRTSPERVETLMLVSTLASADTPAQTERRLGYLQLVAAGNFAGVVEERLPMLVAPERSHDVPLLAVIRKMAIDTGPEAFLRQQRAIMARIDSRPSLTRIACPTLLVFGRHDKFSSLAHQREMLDCIKHGRLETVEDAGHMVPIERPEQFNATLRRWIGV